MSALSPLWLLFADPPISRDALAVWAANQYADEHCSDATEWDIADWIGVPYGRVNGLVQELHAAEALYPPCLRCRLRRRHGRSLTCWECLRYIERLRRSPAYKALRRTMIEGASCARCGATENLTLDHIISLALGGAHERANLQVLCRPCNAAKGPRPVKARQ